MKLSSDFDFEAHSKGKCHTIATATSNPWNSQEPYICLWVYEEPKSRDRASKQRYAPRQVLMFIVKTCIQIVLLGCTMAFLYQNNAVRLRFLC